MHETLEGLEGVFVYADDILVYGCGDDQTEAEKDHDRKLIKLLERCAEANLRINKEKFVFKKTEVSYLGHLITKDGLKPDATKV